LKKRHIFVSCIAAARGCIHTRANSFSNIHAGVNMKSEYSCHAISLEHTDLCKHISCCIFRVAYFVLHISCCVYQHISCCVFHVAYFMLHISCCVYQQISYYQYLYAGVCNEKCQQESARLQVLQHLYVNLIHVAYSIFYILHVAYFMLQISCCEYQRISYYLYLYVGVCDEKC